MNVRKVKEIVKFDVEKSIQNKWFVILNVLTFICILIATNWSNISKYLDEHNIGILPQEEFTIQVLDKEDLAFNDIEEAFKEEKNIKVERVEENNYSKENMPKDDLLLVEVASDSKKVISVKIVSKEAVDGAIYDKLIETLVETRSQIFANNHGVTVDELEVLNEGLKLKREMLGVVANNSETKQMIKLIATVVMYMCLLIVLGRIANEVANEKVSKSIEYVLTSVSAKEYLLAKVLSSTITIIIQLIYTIIYYMIGNMIGSLFVTGNPISVASTSIVGQLDKSIISYILATIGYLIFTVFLTTLIQAALSSKTTSIAEAGNTTMLLVLVVVALYILSNGLIDPYTKVTTFMYIISCIPIVSTFFVPSMMIIGQATTAQVIISFIVLIISIPFVFNICAKVFKNGVLDYTSKKKVGLFNIARKEKKEELSLRERQDLDLRKSKAKKFAFSVGMAMMLFVVLQTICALVFGFTLPTYLNGKLEPTTILVIENSLILMIALGLSSLFMKAYSTDKIEEEKKLTGFQKFEVIFIGIAFIVIVQALTMWLLPKLGIDGGIMEAIGLVPQKTFWGITIFVLGMALVPAIFEELFFRKWILNASKKYGNLFAILFSAILFGIYHMNLSQGIFACLLGIVFGVIVVKTGTIKYTVLLHFLNNVAACIGMIYGENSIIYKFMFNTFIAIAIVGVILIIKNIPNLKKEDWKINQDCKYLLRNYTFIISLVLIIVMFVSTEHMIH